MEVKVSKSVPLWLSRLLSESGCRKQSYSKYVKEYAYRMHQETMEHAIEQQNSLLISSYN